MQRFIPLLALTALGAAQAAVVPPPLDPRDFALLPWWTIPSEPEIYEGVRDCGFNVIMLAEPADLDKLQAAGLQALVTGPGTHVGDAEAALPDAEIAKRAQGLVDAAAGHPATFGFYLRDEPSTRAFVGLGKWKAAYNAAAPGKTCYINLFPNYASAGQLGADTYEDYLERFVAQVQPDFISYDNYSLFEDGSLRAEYFTNLEAVRRVALRHNLPFWNIVLGNAHFSYAEPSPATLRFQAFTTLAYGARGLSYFTYVAPPVGNYRLAPLDQYHHRTPTWEMMRNVNWQVRFILPTYLQYRSLNVYHQVDIPEGGLSEASRQLPLSVTGSNLMVGEFAGPDGRTALMVVNKSRTDSTHFAVTADDGTGSLMMVSPWTGDLVGFGGEHQFLAPGQGSFIVRVP